MPEQQINILAIAPYRFLPVVNGGHKAIEQLYRNSGAITKTIVVSTKSNDGSCAVNYQLVKLFDDNVLHYINPFYIAQLRSLIKREAITHVILEHAYMGWLGIALKKRTGVKLVVRSHNIEAVRFKTIGKKWWKALWYYEKAIDRRADLNFFITEEDKRWAIKHFRLDEDKCSVLTFGIETTTAPAHNEKKRAEEAIRLQYNLPHLNHILLFNGDLGYKPNEEAVLAIIEHIQPQLQKANYPATILICGRNLSGELINQIERSNRKIIYTGYVDDIHPYLLAAGIFINPVLSGGGIKTKLVEALSYDCSAVSTITGATGVPHEITNGKLVTVPDNDWRAFTDAVVSANPDLHIGPDFYPYFNWGNIARKALATLANA